MARAIYTLLKEDHDELKVMLKELVAGKEDRLEDMAHELKIHSQAEEKAFYKPLQGNPEVSDLVAEGFTEHKEADKLSKALMKQKGKGEKFTMAAKQLQEALLHHIKEEEGELFPKAKQIIGRGDAQAIGEQFQAEKDRMMAKV